jgi:hypothetical protein
LHYLSYDDFVRAHNLAPLVDIKIACRVANVGHSRFYELVKDGVFVLIPNGARRNVSAQNLHQHYLALIEGAQSPKKAASRRSQGQREVSIDEQDCER